MEAAFLAEMKLDQADKSVPFFGAKKPQDKS